MGAGRKGFVENKNSLAAQGYPFHLEIFNTRGKNTKRTGEDLDTASLDCRGGSSLFFSVPRGGSHLRKRR